MGLGARNATQHETVGMQKVAVVSEDYWDFRVGQRVMTIDGIPGKVAAVEDGPYPGVEAYQVELDNNLGGGWYRTSELRDMNQVTAGEHHDAATDYPELGDILTKRPDIATSASLVRQANPRDTVEYQDGYEMGGKHARGNPNREFLGDEFQEAHAESQNPDHFRKGYLHGFDHASGHGVIDQAPPARELH